ncbi:MAG: hypothetical protein K9M08_01095 [Pirellula sp.]|nr:hypothetical protein [Pirellula sp.]MCY2977172.1 rhodanese-like domain-containing protein [Planctomycetota bacterium]
MTKSFALHAVLCILICTSMLGNFVHGAQIPRQQTLGNYCGIYAVYGAVSTVLREDGQSVTLPFDDLLQTDFVSSYKGSSSDDLEKAARFLGAEATTYRWLSAFTLRSSSKPLVLHVSPRGRPGKYTHWLLFLGIQDGKALVKDGEGGSFLVDVSDLVSRWDGIAVCVFSRNQSPPNFVSTDIFVFTLQIAVALSLVFLGSSVFHCLLSPTLMNELVVFCCVILCGFVACYCSPSIPKIRRANAFAIAHELGATQFPEISIDELSCVCHDPSNSSVIIDCRYDFDFVDAHLPNAVNMPVDIATVQLLEMTHGLPLTTEFVLYCQSAGCHFSDIIAGELTRLGFHRLRIFRPGMLAWERAGMPCEVRK